MRPAIAEAASSALRLSVLTWYICTMSMSPLRRWRDRAGLTQEEAAARAGCSQPTISLIEAGTDTSLALLRRLIAVYDVPTEEAGEILRQSSSPDLQGAA